MGREGGWDTEAGVGGARGKALTLAATKVHQVNEARALLWLWYKGAGRDYAL